MIFLSWLDARTTVLMSRVEWVVGTKKKRIKIAVSWLKCPVRLRVFLLLHIIYIEIPFALGTPVSKSKIVISMLTYALRAPILQYLHSAGVIHRVWVSEYLHVKGPEYCIVVNGFFYAVGPYDRSYGIYAHFLLLLLLLLCMVEELAHV